MRHWHQPEGGSQQRKDTAVPRSLSLNRGLAWAPKNSPPSEKRTGLRSGPNQDWSAVKTNLKGLGLSHTYDPNLQPSVFPPSQWSNRENSSPFKAGSNLHVLAWPAPVLLCTPVLKTHSSPLAPPVFWRTYKQHTSIHVSLTQTLTKTVKSLCFSLDYNLVQSSANHWNDLLLGYI